jgi:hypothetical protein
MRSVELISVAVEAEALRLKREAASLARSLVLQLAAGLFGLVVMALLHAAAWLWLAHRYGSLKASLFVAGGDIALVAILLWLARRRPDRVAQEALMVRRQAVAQLRAPGRRTLGFFSTGRERS